MLVAAYGVAVKRGYPRRRFPGWAAMCARRSRPPLPGLLIVVIILAGILSGVFTATESAAIAVIYALAAHVLRLSHADAGRTSSRPRPRRCKTTGVVLLLIGVSAMFHYLMALYEVAELDRRRAGAAISTNPWVIFLLINVHPVPARHLHGHGGDHPDLHADLPADRHAATAWIRCSSAW